MQAPSIGVLDCDKNKDMKADIFATLKKRMIRKNCAGGKMLPASI